MPSPSSARLVWQSVLASPYCDERRVPRLPASNPRREREVARTLVSVHAKAVGLEEVRQTSVREDTNVLPRLPLEGLSAMERKRVADPAGRMTDVRERKPLPPEDERRNVVPAREILGRNDRVAAGRRIRRISVMKRSVSRRCSITWLLQTASKVSSANGNREFRSARVTLTPRFFAI
jgi:hypothetical protein